MTREMYLWTCRVIIIWGASICLVSLSSVSGAIEKDDIDFYGQSQEVSGEQLAELIKTNSTKTLSIGRIIGGEMFSSYDFSWESAPLSRGTDLLIVNQIGMIDDRILPYWLAEGFAVERVGSQLLKIEKVADDNFERLTVTADLKIESNGLEDRARKFLPLVQSYAEKHDLDPALIMAIIHTESMFNPRARSRTPAYGLMQLVPHSGAGDAYLNIYGRKRKLTSRYLYDPKNNVELGVAYLNLLKNKYMRSIENPVSRTYCAVAAYNAGAANVGRAFVLKKSMKMAIPVINTMEPQEVYTRLVEKLPFKESRNYIEKVVSLSNLYSNW